MKSVISEKDDPGMESDSSDEILALGTPMKPQIDDSIAQNNA